MEWMTVLILLGVRLAFIAAWVAGWVLASGFWSTLASVVLPPWGWYLIAERLLPAQGCM